MEKKDWNWKNTVLSAVVGFVVGRLTKRLPRPEPVEKSGVEAQALPDDRWTEDATQAALLVMGLTKEAAQVLGDSCLGHKYAPDTPATFDADVAVENAINRVQKRLGQTVPDDVAQSLRTFGRPVVNRLMSFVPRLLSSSIPTVPLYASPQVFDASFALIDYGLRERASTEFLSDPQLLPQLESLLERWSRESKPETYTKPVLHFIHVVRMIRLERHIA